MTTLPPRTLVIPRKSEARRDGGFDRLRDEGLRLIQALCGQTWTDHNLHDPGITALEQLCFALTELTYRAGFPVADHLTGEEGAIDFHALSLHPPAEVFPCRATTAGDHRRVLLDAVPGLDDATWRAAPPVPLGAAGGPAAGGLHRLVLRLTHGVPESAASRVAAARAAWLAERPLGEDLHDAIDCVREVPVDLVGEVAVAGPRDAADVLAEVYETCARFIARPPHTHSLAELLRDGHSLADIFTGPRTANGLFFGDADEAAPADRLFLSDLASVVQGIDGVEDVRLQGLRPLGGAPVAALAWQGDGWALQLRLPADDASGATPVGVAVRRRGALVPVERPVLCRKIADRQAASRARRARMQADQRGAADALLPRGQHRELRSYHSVQHHFPAVYGLGQRGMPASATPQERAGVQQFKAYLLLFEQVVANGFAQLEHLKSLFSLNDGSRQTYWWQALGDDEVPGASALYRSDPEAVQRLAHAGLDASAERKHRALDHLLALHGVTYPQNSLRQSFGHLGADELQALLLDNKAAYLRDIVVLCRDRAGGIDPRQPPWSDARQAAGLQRRACLLLGFAHWHDRPLMRTLRQQRLALLAEADDARASGTADADDVRRTLPLGARSAPASRDEVRADLQAMGLLRQVPLSPALFRVGVRADRYRRVAVDDASRHRLLLGPDEHGRWWHLGDFASEAAAGRAATSLRLYLLHLHQSAEGLHLVEPVLLRPVRPHSAEHHRLELPAAAGGLSVTAVLPCWTARTREPAFQALAEETLQINCPAHVAVRCQWLDAQAMQAFEADWEAWRQARSDHLAALDAGGELTDAALAALDQAAARVLARVYPAPDAPMELDGCEPYVQGHA